MWMEVPPLASPLTSQYLHLSAGLFFSLSKTTLLNFPTDLREFYEGTLLVTLTWVKVLGHIPRAYLRCFM